MATLKMYVNSPPLSGAGYCIKEIISGKRTKTIIQSTFDLAAAIKKYPQYADAEVVRVERERGVAILYVQK